jgi:hypothetical protein
MDSDRSTWLELAQMGKPTKMIQKNSSWVNQTGLVVGLDYVWISPRIFVMGLSGFKILPTGPTP